MSAPNLKPLLDFIAKYESRGDYNIVWSGIRSNHKPKKPLVTMTIGEVLDWQDSIDPHYMSEAAGKFQILEDTLRGLYREADLTLSDKFNEKNQDRLAVALLRRRGLDAYMSGQITANKFCNSLAKEWASLPVVTGPKKGRSYYAGDGFNKAHAPVDGFLSAVLAVRETIAHPSPDVIVHPDPAEQPSGVFSAIIAAILSLFGGRK